MMSNVFMGEPPAWGGEMFEFERFAIVAFADAGHARAARLRNRNLLWPRRTRGAGVRNGHQINRWPLLF
jgi:hypothetical protein